MLVLNRTAGQKVRLGDNVTLTILSVEGGRVLLGVEAPRSVPVVRGELLRRQAAPEATERQEMHQEG